MKILLINLEFDCAGVAWQLREAINRYTPHEAKHVMRRSTMAASHTDRMFGEVEEILDLCEWADVLHFNQWIWTHRPGNAFDFQPVNEYGSGNPFERFLKNKRIVFHFHGGALQLNPKYWIEEAGRVNAVMLKCDPYTDIDDARWIPNLLDFDSIPVPDFDRGDLLKIAVMGGVSDPRRINRLIQDSLTYLQKYYRFEFSFFDNVPRDQALKARAACQISIDNTTQGFIGMWGWESLVMGQALIARFQPDVLTAYESLGIEIPVFDANNVDDIAKYIRWLHDDREELLDSCRLAREWALMNYHPERLVQEYIDIYEGIYG